MIKVGEKLKEERIKKGLTVNEVAKATKIRPSFIQAIENGEYGKLPTGGYAHGFVKNYIEFLGLPPREYMAIFRREFDEKEYLGVLPDSFVGKENIPLRTIRLSRALGLAGLLLVGIFIYVLLQYRSAFFSPSLSVSTPVENAKVSQQTVLVNGDTDPSTTVTINNLPAYVDNSGHFTKEIPVFPGNTTIVVKAVNSFGKLAEIDRHVMILVSQ